MKMFRAICLGFDSIRCRPIARGTPCVIRLDSAGDIQLVSANGTRFDGKGVHLNPYELKQYFQLGFSAENGFHG